MKKLIKTAFFRHSLPINYTKHYFYTGLFWIALILLLTALKNYYNV